MCHNSSFLNGEKIKSTVIVRYLGDGELLLLYSPSDPFESEDERDEEEKMVWSVNLGGVSSLYDDLDSIGPAAPVQAAAQCNSKPPTPPPANSTAGGVGAAVTTADSAADGEGAGTPPVDSAAAATLSRQPPRLIWTCVRRRRRWLRL
jgi:hypothetical protein